jgi:hypothetical protein
MSRVADLRQRADLCRRVARIPTEGGRHEDRVLLIIADQLERDAEELEARVAHLGYRDDRDKKNSRIMILPPRGGPP